MMTDTSKKFDFQKAETLDEHQVLFGWGFISTENGEPYYDLQNDHIPDDAAIGACVNFMKSDRVGLIGHEGERIGTVLSMFPLTKEIAEKSDIQSKFTGALVCFHIEDPDLFQKAKEGEFTSFSIGGKIVEYEEVS